MTARPSRVPFVMLVPQFIVEDSSKAYEYMGVKLFASLDHI